MRTPNEHKKYVAPAFRKGFSVDAEGTDNSKTSRAIWNGGDCIRRNGDALYERHLVFDRAIDPKVASARERFEAFSHSVRDILAQRWVQTKTTYEQQNAKRIYYLSMEFLHRAFAGQQRYEPLA